MCELNFTTGVSKQAARDLRRDYYAMQEIEEAATESMLKSLLGKNLRQATVFIPSLIAEFDRFWKRIL